MGQRVRSVPPWVDPGDVGVGPAEMVRKFVNDDMRDQFAQRDIAAIRPFKQDGKAKEPDRVGLANGISCGFEGDGDAFVHAGQLERVVYPHFPQHLLRGEVDDAKQDVLGFAAKLHGQGLHRLGGKSGDDLIIGRTFVVPAEVCVGRAAHGLDVDKRAVL